MSSKADLEVRFGWVGIAAVVAFGALLAAGVVLHVLDPGGAPSRGMLEAGLVTLMLAPAVRLTVAVAERVRRRDWTFVIMTGVVVLELVIVMWRAASKVP
jgi:hypothetical protein